MECSPTDNSAIKFENCLLELVKLPRNLNLLCLTSRTGQNSIPDQTDTSVLLRRPLYIGESIGDRVKRSYKNNDTRRTNDNDSGERASLSAPQINGKDGRTDGRERMDKQMTDYTAKRHSIDNCSFTNWRQRYNSLSPGTKRSVILCLSNNLLQ